MTYSRLLLQFLALPIAGLVVLVLRDRYVRKRYRAAAWQGWRPYRLLVALLLVAVLYTTPWDNHLIATGVWWYRPALVSGAAVGYIPVEEMIFFLLQTLLIGLWCLWLGPRLASRDLESSAGTGANGRFGESVQSDAGSKQVRLIFAIVGGSLWLIALVALRLGWQPATYLAWELIWALPPIILQLSLGGDILWQHRRLLWATLVPAIIYLCSVDTLAIHGGIWTIDPHQSLGVLLAGQLPLEEVIFFSLTSTLVAFGLVLGVAAASRERLHARLTLLARRFRFSAPRDTAVKSDSITTQP